MKWVFFVFVGLYAIALLLLAIGTFGWFGQEQDPLSGVFLVPLGLPWNLLADRIGQSNAAVAILAPLVNAAILYAIWKRFSSGRFARPEPGLRERCRRADDARGTGPGPGTHQPPVIRASTIT
ncbi:hypothetical protein [Aurantiacibacter hainanensis]|uniref:hypothetical protein n=1 Tax=Aurantiacibacter hainanensis TaxID=3076114 RepID=UPI0030C77CC4